MALIGAVAFLITFLTLIAGTGKDSVFGYGFLPGILALVIWSIATSIAMYRNDFFGEFVVVPIATSTTSQDRGEGSFWSRSCSNPRRRSDGPSDGRPARRG